MASSRKGKSKQIVNSTAEKGQQYMIINAYFVNDCSGVQIGNANQQYGVFDNGAQLLEQPLEAESHGFKTDQVVVAMLNSILNPTHSANAPPVRLQKLEDSFNKLYGNVRRKRRFKEITGLNLLPFLKLKPEKFHLTLKESNWFVQSIPLTLNTKVIQGSLQSENEVKQETIQQRSAKTIEAVVSSETSSDGTSEEETDDGWTVVERKKGSKAKRLPSKTKRKAGSKISTQRKSYASILARPPKQGNERTERVSVKPAETKGHEMLVPSSPFTQAVNTHGVEHTQSAFETFMKAVDNFKKGHFVLMTADLPDNALSKSTEVLTSVPWILVFDFDENSRDRGLLARVEEPLKSARSLHVCSWRDHVKVSEMATTWYFIRGYREIPETRFEKGYRDWFKQVKFSVTTLAEDISSFVQDTTVLKVVVIWNDKISKYLDYIVCKLDENVQQGIQIIICRDDSGLSSQNDFTHMCGQVEENITVINISAPNLFLGIFDHVHKSASSKRNYDLLEIPAANDCGNTVDKQGFAWLHEYIDVIYTKIHEDSSSDVEAIEDEAHVFFKGGTLKWATRFLCGSEYLDVERDAMDQIAEKIKCLVLSFKSGLYTLHHAPGSGGSTLAQRVLWKLRDISPCVQIHFHSGASVGDIVSRLEYLYERTHLPIIALIDGEDEHNVRYLRRSVRQICLAVLYVKRYPYSMSEKMNTSKDFWLQGHVSKREARNLATKFGSFCKDETKADALKALSKDVKEGTDHQLYEFGLTAYLHEFNGIRSYVDGYLRLDKDTSNELHPWQKMLGYISLVYYYGQTSIPRQFFAHMLGKLPNYVVSFDDFPFEVRQFVVIDSSKGKSNEMRACHYIIAKEILEQLLTRGHASRSDRNESLSSKACDNLGKFAVSFIDDASQKKVKSAVCPQAIMHVLVQTFISRDSKGMGESETQSKKRPSLAKLLVDITSKPPYPERLRVLQKLSNAFPEEPNFHAHLGRFYAMCRPNEEDKAIRSFETALKLCEKKMEAKHPEEQNERLKITLSHIYHMYGMIYGQNVNRFKCKQNSELRFDEMASHMLELAESACDLFVKCREAKPPGHEDSFGYVGEINVRLQVCDFVRQHSGYENMHDFIAEEKDSENGSQIATFIEKSITAINDLIIECLTVVDPADIDSSFINAVTWHQRLLGKYGQGLEALHLHDTIGSKRFKIAAKKLKHGGHAHFDSIRCEADIKEIVATFQEIFEDAFNRGVEDRRTLDIDFQEWLHVIRHESLSEVYSLETVLSQVRQWHSMLSSPMSKFCLFVLTSIIGFGSEMGNGNPECLSEAQNLKEELRKYGRWVTRSRYPREWLGKNGKGIKCLISNKFYAGNSEGEVTKVSNARRPLCVCRGTIRPPNKNKVAGFIELDLGNNYVPVSVFFVPLRTEFEGPINSGVRVEFHLGFSFFNGCEAFNVKALKKYECISCGSNVEILSCEESQRCVNERCQQQILKSELAVPRG